MNAVKGRPNRTGHRWQLTVVDWGSLLSLASCELSAGYDVVQEMLVTRAARRVVVVRAQSESS